MAPLLAYPLWLLFFLPLVSCSCPLKCKGSPFEILRPFTTNLECGGSGWILISCEHSGPTIHLPWNRSSLYVVENIDYDAHVIILRDPTVITKLMQRPNCSFLYQFTEPNPYLDPTHPLPSVTTDHTLFDCNPSEYDFSRDIMVELYDSTPCQDDYSFHYSDQLETPLPSTGNSTNCRPSDPPYFQWKLSFEEDGSLALNSLGYSSQQLGLYRSCFSCHITSKYCSSDKAVGDPACSCGHVCSHHTGNSKWRMIAIGVGVGGGLLVLCLLFFLWYSRRRIRQRSSTSSKFLIQPGSSKLNKTQSMKDLEEGSTSYNTHLFSYAELHEATNGFDAARELGDGGFGTVYKGQLKDGRIVAVKRLYENNFKRVEQFLNEVVILSQLRHKNLVTLYGCTSRHSRELLLVYEYIPNGTVADHLHGPRAPEGALTWPLRLNVAIQTAEALAYLHATEPQIIHRDVKTTNILLDEGFHVKVADFGLSRLFPIDATHVSTLPQGTPGYVDPEYHQCYQLTDKSDVYSFGVVLVELISSMPAVDITRHRHEINLATLAINKIQSRQIGQLVDPGLMNEADWETERMITTVAELAFRCLQAERDMRPSIKEVVEELKQIQNRGAEKEADVQTSDDTRLLKNVMPFSPDSVTLRWESTKTTPNTSA